MTGYILRRLLQAIPTLWVISLVLFFGMQLVPGGPTSAFGANPRMSAAAQQAIIHRWGLDQPLYIQYGKWLESMVTGNWGMSFYFNGSVRDAIASRLPATLVLMGTAYALQELIALPAGIVAALRRYSWFDQVVTSLSYVFYSMPTFWLGLILILVFGVYLGVLPVGGIVNVSRSGGGFLTSSYDSWFLRHPGSALLDLLRHLLLPAVTIAAVGVAADFRFMRAAMLDVVHQDYMRTARAKGLPERIVVLKHGVRNALLPVVTNFALALPQLFSGAVVAEAIFNWQGMGQLFYAGLSYSDYPLMMGILCVAAVIVVFSNLLADVAYAVIDPRISYG